MGGQTIRNEDTKVAGFQINSATYGLTVPLVLGTSRISPNVIDYYDFAAIPHTETQHAGKGGGTTIENTTYTYVAAVLLGLAEGPGQVGKVWADDVVYNSMAAINMTLFTGEYGQTPWSYTQSKYPDKALPYSGLAYAAGVIDLNSSGGLKNYNFEYKGLLRETGDGIDVNPADAIAYICSDPVNGVGFGIGGIDTESLDRYRTFCKAADLLITVSLTDTKKAYEIINDICKATNTIVFWSQNKLKLVPKCDEEITGNGVTYMPDTTPLYNLTDNDFLDDDPLVEFQRADNAEAYNHVPVKFVNRSNAYEEETADGEILVDINKRGRRSMSEVDLSFICTRERAEYVANLLVSASLYGRNTYSFKLGWSHCLLEPGDFVTIYDPVISPNPIPVLIDTIEEGEDGDLEVTTTARKPGANSASRYITHGAERYMMDRNVDPGDGVATVFNPSTEITGGGLETWIAASGGDKWGGCSVWGSDTGDQYQRLGTLDGPSRHGVLTDALPAGSPIDATNILKVQLYSGQLTGGTEQDAQNLNTLCWVDGELIAYGTATLTGTKQYNLSYLVRGVYNTPIAIHVAGSKFVRLDKNLFKYAFTADQVGKQIYLKYTSRNIYGVAEQSLADVDPVTHILTAQAPPDVGNIRLDEDTYILRDGTVLSDIRVIFDEPGILSLDHYNVYYDLNNNGEWEFSGVTSNGKYVIKALPQAKVIKVKVITVNKAVLESAGVESAGYTITGKSDPPSDVTSLSATQNEYNRAEIILSWPALDATVNPDVRGYEARVGNSGWDTAVKVKLDTIVGTTTSYIAPGNGYYKFYLKAIDNSGNYSTNATTAEITVIIVPDAPTGLTAAQDEKDRSQLIIAWTASPGNDIAAYQLKYGNNWANGTDIAETKETAYKWTIPVSGNYNIMVRAVTTAGNVSNIANVSVSSMTEPYDVTGFKATQSTIDKTVIRLSWDAPLSLDVSYYVIKKGNWDTGDIISPSTSGTFFDTTIDDETEQVFLIKAVSRAGKESQNPATVRGIYSLNPSPVTAIQASQSANDKSILNIMWSGVSDGDLAEYQVRIGDVWDSAEPLLPTKELYTTYKLTHTGNYKIMLKTKNTAGFYSDEASITYYAKVEPVDVAGFVAYQNGDMVQLYWEQSSELDVTSYEIREGATFDQGRLVATGLTQPSFDEPVDSERVYRYFVKAINRAGFYSLTAASVSVQVINLPTKNVISEYDQIALQSGTHSNTEFGQSLINWSNMGGRFSDYPTTRFSDVGGQTVLKLKKRNLYPDDIASIETDDVLNAFTWKTSPTIVMRSRSTAEAKYGASSLFIDHPDTGNIVVFWLDESEAVNPNELYTASIWIKGTGSFTFALVEVATDGSTTVVSTIQTLPSNEWTRYSLSKTLLNTASYLRVAFGVRGTSSMYLDGIQIEPGSEATEFGSYFTSGTYAPAQIDVGQIITANITAQFVSTVILKGSGSVILQMRTSQDGSSWTNWATFKPVQYTFRYAEFRVLLATDDIAKTPEVNQFIIKIDVPDTDIAKTAAITTGGTTVAYGHTYYTVPIVTPTAIGEGLHPELISKTQSNCVIKIKNASNVDVGGQADIRVKGY